MLARCSRLTTSWWQDDYIFKLLRKKKRIIFLWAKFFPEVLEMDFLLSHCSELARIDSYQILTKENEFTLSVYASYGPVMPNFYETAALEKNSRSFKLIIVVQSLSRVWLYDPMGCSMPGISVLHHLPELAQTHVHCVGDAIQPSHPLSFPFPPTFNLSLHQGLT